ncbi:PAS domain S-box protein [Brevundimonas sp. Leaf363]|uniref:PAS domain S-box protein n=1 Tax=Brevundimonas sp. Leaf363 TaxID=1736353 RepID=UPI00138F5569|nr:PAS domain S-box protein [Brevundimonas sp. Leaf363]
MDADIGLAWLARQPPATPLRALAVGVFCAGVITLLRWMLRSAYGDLAAFTILFPALMVASLAAGRIAGFVAMAASLVGVRLILGDTDSLDLNAHIGRVGIINYLIVGTLIVLVGASLRRTVRNLDATVGALKTSDARIGESEARLQAMVDQASVGIAHVGADGRVTSSNARFAQILGLATDKSGVTTPDVTHPDDIDKTLQLLEQMRAGGPGGQVEKRYIRPDGSIVWALTSLSPLTDASGRQAGYIGVVVDITAEKLAEAALRESESRFRLMADNAPSPVWLTNTEGEVEFVNAALVDFYGRSADAFTGRIWRGSVHPDDVPAIREVQAHARPLHLPYGFEARFQRHDGAWRWMRISVNPRFGADGQFMGYVGMSFDIDDTRRALAALEQQERRQSFLLSLSDRLRDLTDPDAIMNEVERALGAELNVHRVGYGEVDATRGVVAMTRDWTAGVVSAQGLFTLDTFGADLITDLARGEVIRIPDVREDPRTRAAADAFASIQTSALIRAPLIRAGALRAFLYAHSSEPRQWTDTEVALLEEVADRTWTEVERARAETELRESEQRFRAIADTAPVLIWVTRQDRIRDFVNEAYVAFQGGTYDEARLEDWRTIVHPDDHARLVQESLAGEATAQPFSMEARYRRHDGVYRWLKSFSRPRLGPGGEVIGFVGVAFDVTDIRETNARLAAVAAERDAILGQLAEGVIVTDPQGAIVFVNEAAKRQHGVEALNVTPDQYTDRYHLLTEDGRPFPSEQTPLARAVLQGETVLDARWRIRRADGDEVLAVGNARPVTGPDGERIGAVLTLRDETARIKAEQRLSESEARFRTVADTAPALIWMTDAEGATTFANRRFRGFFGIKTERQLATGWRDAFYPEDLPLLDTAFARALEGRQRFEHVARVQHPTHGLRWLRMEGAPRFDAAGYFQGYIGASIDVTEAKKAEDDLKRINELLEERVGDALAEKAKAEADLMHAQRMEAVGRLTGGVAHDFNNLLTVVIGALDIILRSEDPAKRKKLGEAALSAARRGERLTHQLLAFSRRQALRPEAMDVNGLIREGEPLLRRAVGEAVEFKLKLRRGGARVSVDPAQFEAALLNLVVNARDAVGETGRITVQTQQVSVAPGEVVDLPAGDYVCVSVSDDGQGMTPEVMRQVFEPFFTTKSVGKGTGLGLSQVYGFARQSGGGVRIVSAPGKGADIRLYLPPLGPEAPRERVVARPIAPVGAGQTVLLVEDDAGVAAIAVDILEGLGMRVVTAETGPQALERLKRGAFDLMLTDIVMPGGMTGVELARRAAKSHPQMRVALTSGYVGEDVDEALADAPWPFLRKPYSADDLRRLLSTSPDMPA